MRRLGASSMGDGGVSQYLKYLDIFPKSSNDVVKRESSGGIVMFLFLFLVGSLILVESYHFMFPQTDDTLGADIYGRREPVTVYLDLEFPVLSCDRISVDVVDHNNQHIGGNKHLDKQALNRGQGCRVKGWLLVPRVKGNIHVAPGATANAAHSGHSHHVHRLSPDDLRKGGFDVAHRIRRLSFGPGFSTQRNPLEGAIRMEGEALAQVSYFIQIVPEISLSAGGNVYWEGFSYAASAHNAMIDATQPQFPMPGLFFKFDFSAYVILHKDIGLTFTQYIARVASIVGALLFSLRIFAAGLQTVADKAKKRD